MKSVALTLALVLAAATQAQTLVANTTTNNGTGGVFLDLTPTGSALRLDSFATFFGGATGTTTSIEVWTRPGSYSGFTASNAGWTLSQTVSGTSAGTTTLSPSVALTSPITLPTGSTTAVYLHSITAGNGLRYFGTGTTSNTTFSNADLTLFSDVARTGAASFGGTQFAPRAFAGELTYTVRNPVPEPATLAALGLGGLALLRRRKRA